MEGKDQVQRDGDHIDHPSDPPSDPPRKPAAEAIDTDLGRYVLRQPLPHAGLGAWFEAWDRALSRPVALHFPADQADAPSRVQAQALFVTAMQPGAQLQHAYIAAVVDVGAGARGPYLATEVLAGRTMAQALSAGWQPALPRAVLLMQRVAQGLAHAHAQGVCHGALEPANIWLVDDAQPKLRAFGVAAAAHASALPELDPLVIGAGHYLAPEQLLGDVVDERTDVHAVGAMLYELLSGRQAYPGHTVSQVAHALLKLTPPAPHLLRPELPVGLSDIVMRALHRVPAERYASAAELADALAAWLKDIPMPADAMLPPSLTATAPALGRAAMMGIGGSRWFNAGLLVAAAAAFWVAWKVWRGPGG